MKVVYDKLVEKVNKTHTCSFFSETKYNKTKQSYKIKFIILVALLEKRQ